MLAEVKVYKFLEENKELREFMDSVRGMSVEPNPIYSRTPDDKYITDDNAPWIRITSIPGDEAVYADNQRYIEYPKIQVDAWIAEEDTQNTSKMIDMLYQIMSKHGYERYYEAHDTDLDMKNLTMITGNYQYRGIEGPAD